MYYSLLLLALFSGPVIALTGSTSGKIQFAGVGYDFQYRPITKITDSKNDCSCQLGDEEWMTGPNAPFTENLAVHVRGPLNLYSYAYYTTSNYSIGVNGSSNWTRQAYFDNYYQHSDSLTMDNVTFLAHVGDSSSCLGKALSYIKQDGVTPDTKNGAPGKYMQRLSGVEYLIYSNISCPKSGSKNGCGVYRDNIPAFYGFSGTTKMFLFEFSMPNDTVSKNSSDYYNQPRIWLSSDSLPRVTSNYGYQSNCSCIFQGCGSVDVFAANSTVMDSTLSSFQGLNGNTTADIASMIRGVTGNGQYARPFNTTVTGGIIFDTAGNVVTFLTDNLDFAQNISFSNINAMLNRVPSLGDTTTLKEGSSTGPVSSTAKKNAGVRTVSSSPLWIFCTTIVTAFIHSFVL